jgi:hypothetical protein
MGTRIVEEAHSLQQSEPLKNVVVPVGGIMWFRPRWMDLVTGSYRPEQPVFEEKLRRPASTPE